MKSENRYLDELMERYPALAGSRASIARAYALLESGYERGGKLLIAGNGGSAADAEHIVGELMKGFALKREIDEAFAAELRRVQPALAPLLCAKLQRALPAIALDGHSALNTAYMNDCEPLLCFAQQVNGYGCAGDTFLGISTSGNSRNILYAAAVARAKGMTVLALTGEAPNRLSEFADVSICVPGTEAYKVQELHLPAYHCLCLMLEEHFFGGGAE